MYTRILIEFLLQQTRNILGHRFLVQPSQHGPNKVGTESSVPTFHILYKQGEVLLL